MRKTLTTLGLTAAAVTFAAPSALATGTINDVIVSGNTVTIYGSCPTTAAEIYYGVPNGNQPIQTTVASVTASGKAGNVFASFSGVKPGSYLAFIHCGNDTDTGQKAFRVGPRGGAATGDGASQAGMSDTATTGAALAAAGLGMGVVVLRRRNAHR